LKVHEVSIAQSLLEIVEEEVARYPGARVSRISLRIGRLREVIPESLRFAFEVISKGRVTEGASLHIEEVPLSLRCLDCQRVWVAETPFMICPGCGGREVEIISGQELEIESLEIEDGAQGS